MNKQSLMMRPLSEEQIRQNAPQVYAPAPKPGLSARYTFLPTSQIITDMEKLGWKVCSAEANRSRSKVIQEFGTHRVRFFHPDIFLRDQDGNIESYVMFILYNSHAGLGGFKMTTGLYRLVCSNGLVIQDKDFGSFEIRHVGYSFEQLQETISHVIDRLPEVVGKINDYNQVILTEKQQFAFAKKALQLRSNPEYSPTRKELVEFLTPRRPEDQGDSLWVILNRVQEAVLNGGYYLTNAKGKPRKAKSIRNIQKDLQLNQQIWELATQYA